MTVNRRAFLRSTTTVGAALGGAALFSTATNFRTTSHAVDAPGVLGSAETVETLHQTGLAPGQRAPLSSTDGFLSVNLPEARPLGEPTPATVTFEMAGGEQRTVNVAMPDEGRDDQPTTNVSEMIEVPEGAEAVVMDGGDQLNLHAYAATDKPTVGVTPYAAGNAELAELSSNITEEDVVGSLILGGVVAATVAGLSNAIPGLPSLPTIPGVPGGVSNVIDGLNVVSRTGWGANEGLMGWTPGFSTAQMITVHHTAMRTSHNTDYASQVRGIYDYHARQLGWGDIGYHLLIAPNGTVFQGRATGDPTQAVFSRGSTLGIGRPQVVTGGHVYNANDGNVGVCLMGDFTNEAPTGAAIDSLVRVLGHLCRGLGIDPRGHVRYVNHQSGLNVGRRSIVGHRDWGDVSSATACPGNRFYPQLDSVRGRI